MLPSDFHQACLSEEEVLAFVLDRQESAVPPALAEHLDTCTRCQTLVAEGARAYLSGRAGASQAGQARTLADGELVLGRYQVRRFIGAGGMGEVYEVLDRDLGEVIALKTVTLTTLDDQRSVSRLKAEVQLARRITHPGVCRIFDFAVYLRASPGPAPEAIPLLTMELLAGETLASALHRRGRMTTAEALPILQQILAGLGAVHAADIVHRDLKAENVFLVQRPDSAELRAVLMDFGLARAAPSGASRVSRHALVGTASYMAPEQVEGRPVSFASDVYAAGVLMFEMVTGRLPFEGDNPMAVALSRLQVPPPPPSGLVPDLDPRWEEVILRCLARAPADRYQSAQEIAAALAAPRIPAQKPVARARRKSGPLLLLGAGLALLAAAPLVLLARRAPVPPPPPSAVVLPAPAGAPRPEPPPAPAPAVEPAMAEIKPIPTRVRRRRALARSQPAESLAVAPLPAPDAAAPPPAPQAAPPLHPDEIVNPFRKP